MAKGKKKARRSQGVLSWVGSVFALAIGLSGVVTAIKVGGLQGLANRASFGMLSGGKFNLSEGLAVYAPMVGGLVFKKFFSSLTRAARIQTMIPRIG